MSPKQKLDLEVGPPSFVANNDELLIWSLYLLGGAEQWVDVEDMYLKAFELAPARLSWRTKPDIPDYKKIAKALQSVEAKNSKHHGLFDKRGAYERKLTLAGLAWCETYRSELSTLYSGDVIVPSASIQNDGRRVRDIESSDAFQRWSRDRSTELEEFELAEIFRCLPGSPRATWVGRFDEVSVAAKRNGRSDIEDFIDEARRKILTN